MFNPGQLGVNAPPSQLVTDTGASPALQILQYRSQLSSRSYALMASIAQYITGISTNLDEKILPTPSGDEDNAMDKLYDLGNTIAGQADPVIAAMIGLVNNHITTEQPDFDIQTLLDKAVTELFAELDSADASVEVARELLMSIVNSALLNSAYGVLADADIDNAIDAFKTNAKSQADDQIITLDRKTINEHITDGMLDSDIGANIITRAMARKVRQYTEIDNQALIRRLEYLNAQFQQKLDRERNKVQAGALLSRDMIRLPDALYDLIGELARRRFADVDSFAQALPNLLSTSAQALDSVKRNLQSDRFRQTEIDIESAREIINLWNVISTNLRGIATSLGAMGTFEAS